MFSLETMCHHANFLSPLLDLLSSASSSILSSLFLLDAINKHPLNDYYFGLAPFHFTLSKPSVTLASRRSHFASSQSAGRCRRSVQLVVRRRLAASVVGKNVLLCPINSSTIQSETPSVRLRQTVAQRSPFRFCGHFLYTWKLLLFFRSLKKWKRP
ncbi:hypothetical protein BVRB_8g183630 [Beta vulgaris subsp. vulgaris]|nr:hypothetical protein BVRB_8g183630 [Beta vulgaris subsp. vulgaris]